MRKIPKCKNCGGKHYTYQCWSKPPKQSTHKTITSKSNSTYNRQKIIQELDKTTSSYIRQKGMDKSGYNYCYTCGVRLPWKALDCGHYIKRRYLNTRWLLQNMRPQCPHCNRALNGNYKIYEQKIRLELGDNNVQKMWDLAYSNRKLSTIELQELLKTRKEQLKNLQKTL